MFLIFIGCSKDPQEVNIYSIPDEFRIDLHQAVSIGGTYPAFRISTLESKACSNDHIIATISKVGTGIEIDIIDIDQAIDCNNLSGKLWSDIYADLQPGIYPLSVTLKDQISNDGLLMVTEKEFSLTLKTEHGILKGKSEVLKIPDGLIWGYSIKKPGISSTGNNIVEHLNPFLSTRPMMQQGDYGLFRIIDDNNYILFSDPGQNIDSPFLRKMDTSISEIRAIINKYKEATPEADFRIYTSRGMIN